MIQNDWIQRREYGKWKYPGFYGSEYGNPMKETYLRMISCFK